jgi:hypothetical protein
VAAGARITFRAGIFAVLLAVAAGAHPAARPASPAGLELLDLEGRPVRPLAGGDARGYVFILARTDCPISNRYAPELQKLHQRFAPAGIVFRLVYPDPADDPEAIRRHVEDFGYPFDALRDPKHRLVHLAQATVTPEAIVFAGGGSGPRLVYRGRIDDRYVDFGKARAAAKSRDLERILEAIEADQALRLRTTPAVGCAIPRTE